MNYREATAGDAEAIADLHADSWRRHYRGALLDSYLDGDVVEERRTVWTNRLSRPAPDRHTVVADVDGAIAGFAHTVLDADRRWGSLLDNLHVRHDFTRQGIGARLLTETARAVTRSRPSTGLYLWVLAQNTAAQAFYRTHGGIRVERELAGPFPGGGRAFAFRYVWRDLSELIG
ncbi:GNAT family N-acetyltransferase [Actinophytocola sp.]|uniref:GNAT family N-acetyltransferase n=1 Tax=Actinophytocola sp. TaxID=1872138 RepID=UPI002ED1D76D